jgi:CheY-like chemotaxis protein
MLADMLEDDFVVMTADNGLEALDIVIARPRNHFDAILLDINMPIMDGFECCEKINKYIQSAPIIQMVEVDKSLNSSQYFGDAPEKSLFAPIE